MTFSVFKEHDALKICVVGQAYPPEFYSWITVPAVRDLFEKMSLDTEQDFQNLISKLNQLGVQTIRPNLPSQTFAGGQYVVPPVSPRDHLAMIDQTFYYSKIRITGTQEWKKFYNNIKDPSWPQCDDFEQFATLPEHIQYECKSMHGLNPNNFTNFIYDCYDNIIELVKAQGNQIKSVTDIDVNGAMVLSLENEKLFGTPCYDTDTVRYQNLLDKEFPNSTNRLFNTGGHLDGTFCIPCPGLIFSLKEINTWHLTHPGWEVVYLEGNSAQKSVAFQDLKQINKGRWWIPGWEYEWSVTEAVETWFKHWTGFVEETVPAINMLIVDQHNVIVSIENDLVMKTLERYNITSHLVPFRSTGFWDAGIHCVTADLHREVV